MPIKYTTNPIRLTITAKLEMEDGQTFVFNTEVSDFDEEVDSVAGRFDEVSSQVYEKLEEFTSEYEDEDVLDYFNGASTEVLLYNDEDDDEDEG